MKIGCPQCGQHYEIDANMLDRYYRCTECKTLFWGLNAKPVKQLVAKSNKKSEKSEDSGDGESAVEAVGAPVDSLNLEEDNNSELPGGAAQKIDAGTDDEDSLKHPVLITAQMMVRWERPVAVIALLVALAAVVVAAVSMARCYQMTENLQAALKVNETLGKRLAAIELRNGSINNELLSSRDRLDNLAKDQMLINGRVNDYMQVVKQQNADVRLGGLEKRMLQLNEQINIFADALKDGDRNTAEDENRNRRRRQR